MAKMETKKTNQLLQNLMPPHALRRLQMDMGATDLLTDVTLLYADIVGFTSWSSTRNPDEIVDMLSQLFTKFDWLCVEMNVYKVYTIGDCYVVMSYKDE